MKFFISTLILLTLASCSKDNNTAGTTATPLPAETVSGTLVDSPIGGVHYRTNTFSGMTDDSGKYNCLAEEIVEFYLKGENGEEIALGEVGCSGVISPIELATGGRFNIETNFDDIPLSDRSAVLGMLRFFQSMNASGDISQGITIRASDVSTLAAHFGANGLTLDTAMAGLLSSGSFDADLSAAMGAVGKAVVSADDALEHFRVNQALCNQNTCTPASQPPVVVDQPAEDHCYQGASYAVQTFGSGGLSYSNTNPISGTGDPIPNPGFLAKTSTMIMLKSDHSAYIYRTKSGSTYYRFSATWSVDSSGRLSVDGINFTNGVFNWYFGAESTASNISTRVATPQTLGSMDNDFDRTWHKQEGCYVPSSIEIVNNLP